MSQYANQHFLPKFYFRRFSGDSDAINLVHCASGKIILDASISHQCAAHKLHGTPEVEQALNQLEGRHANALRVISDAGWKSNWSGMTPEILGDLWQGILLQWSRTLLNFEKSKDIPNSFGLPAFRAYIASRRDDPYRDRILEAIDKGQVRIAPAREYAVLQSISLALESVLLISDLGLCVLRNHTDFPFVFSDSPVVLYNTLMRNVVSRGVLGLQTPGLQIFFPLDADMTLMLYDEAAYNLKHDGAIDLILRSDVSQLNALQFKHSLNAVYFGDLASLEYVGTLWVAHGRTNSRPAVEARVLRSALIDGRLETRPITQIMEPHLDFRLSLSFIKCEPLPDSGNFPGHRTPDLAKEHKARIKRDRRAKDSR